MPVVQPLQRVQSLAADIYTSQRAAQVMQGHGLRGHLRPETMCAIALMTADAGAFAIAAIVAGLAGTVAGDLLPAEVAGQPIALGTGIASGMVGYFIVAHGLYTHRKPFVAECRSLVSASAAALLFACAAAFLFTLPLPRTALVGTAMLFPLSAAALRRLARSALDTAGLWRIPVVLVGSDGDGRWVSKAAADLTAHAELGYEIVARAAATPATGAAGLGWLLRQHCARLVVLAFDAGDGPQAGLIAALARERIPYALLRQDDAMQDIDRQRIRVAQDSTLVFVRDSVAKPVARSAKLALDVVGAASALVVLAPVMLAIAAAVGLDGGPIFYAHKRIGVNGRVFDCLKFRSMVTDGDRVLRQLLETDPASADEWARTQKLRRDPRVTWIGRLLRKTSLDELPQLLNVLRLEMSLVGPRPIVSLEIPKYGEDIAYYYAARPGITGLWQVSGRSDTTYAQRVRLDSHYVRNWSFWADMVILLRTIPAVLSGRGAG